jgi:MFS family permease
VPAIRPLLHWSRSAPWARLGPDFTKLWLGQTVSALGSGIGGTALPLAAVLVLKATPIQMGLLVAISTAPVLVVGLPAGTWVDRLRRRPVLIAADVGRAVLLASIPLAALLHVLDIEQLYVVAALVGVLTVFFDVADQAFLPSVVPRESLVVANSTLGASDSVAEIGGPALAGGLVQWLSAPVAILFDAVSFLFSALCVGLIRAQEPLPERIEQRQSLWRDVAEGLRMVLRHPVLRALAGSSGTFTFFGSFVGALYFLYAIRVLGVPPGAVGLLVAAGGVSAFAGALVAGRVVQRFGPRGTLGGALLAYGALSLLIPLATGPVIVAGSFLLAAQLLGDVAIEIYLINELSLRQAIIPDRLLGRANASMHVLSSGASPLGAVLAGALGQNIGLRWTLLIGVLGIMMSSLWIFRAQLPVASGSSS